MKYITIEPEDELQALCGTVFSTRVAVSTSTKALVGKLIAYLHSVNGLSYSTNFIAIKKLHKIPIKTRAMQPFIQRYK